jgi:hypothetical protein
LIRRLAFLAWSAVALTGCGGPARRGVGPLADSVRYASVTSAATDVGQVTSFGVPLANPTGRTLTIDDVTPVDPIGAAQLLHASFAHHPPYVTGAMRGYPPSDLPHLRLHAARGWRIAAHETFDELLLAVRMPKSGVSTIEKVRIDYHDARRSYRAELPYKIEVCAPLSRWRHCPATKLPS